MDKKYVDDSNLAKWMCFFDDVLRLRGGKLFLEANLIKKEDLLHFNIMDTFLKEVLEYWCEVNYHGSASEC